MLIQEAPTTRLDRDDALAAALDRYENAKGRVTTYAPWRLFGDRRMTRPHEPSDDVPRCTKPRP